VDAVAALPGTGMEGLKAIGCGFGSFDDFVDVDVHPHAHLFDFLPQVNAYTVEDVVLFMTGYNSPVQR
jgi:hypothetical protein